MENTKEEVSKIKKKTQAPLISLLLAECKLIFLC